MPLVVVMLAPDETDLLSLGEWRRLATFDRVFFERIDHPLAELLRRAGVDAAAVGDDLSAEADAALVADPGSERALGLARAGASVTSGAGPAFDPLTVARGARVARRVGVSAARLASIMSRLRGPDGCPWDKEQTHSSLRPHLIEEAYEVVDAIEQGRLGSELEAELGDVLLQVAFHAQMADDDGRFDLAGVADAISAKLVQRHPHVFADEVVETAQQVVQNWETLKAKEHTGRTGPFDGIPRSLPALVTAYKTQKRAASLGFDASADEAADEVRGALDRDDLGDALFWLVALARARGLDPEGALRESIARFRRSLHRGR